MSSNAVNRPAHVRVVVLVLVVMGTLACGPAVGGKINEARVGGTGEEESAGTSVAASTEPAPGDPEYESHVRATYTAQELAETHEAGFQALKAGRVDYAIATFEQVIPKIKIVEGPTAPMTLTAINNLAWAYRTKGNIAKAKELYSLALKGRENALGPNSPPVAKSLLDLAELAIDEGQRGVAEQYLLRAAKIAAMNPAFPSPPAFRIWSALGRLQASTGRHEVAVESLKRAAELAEPSGAPSGSAFDVGLQLAESNRALERRDEARFYYRWALAIAKATDSRSDAIRVLSALRSLARQEGDQEAAKGYEAEALELESQH
jgi:tetratricopeptide (TPR) repeat protein